jgi:hypothetical protein
MQRWFTLIGLLLVALLAACAPSGGSTPGATQEAADKPTFLFFFTDN